MKPMTMEDDSAGATLGPIAMETTLLRQKVVASLRRAIELGTLKAGDRLVEKDLCDRLGVSRTSLREALRDLEANGVITKLSPRELVITVLSPSDAANLYGIRGAIETLVAEQFIAHSGEQDVRDLREALDQMRRTGAAGSAALDARREFYRVWCKAARDPFALEYLTNLQLRLSVLSRDKSRNPDLVAQDVAEKEVIINLLERRDVDGVRQALRDHARHATEAAFPAGEPPRATAAR
jgi:DNA-binding GntR family transcriptional regulator